MEGLPWLQALDAKAHEGISVYGIPEIMNPRTKLPFLLFVSEGIVRIDCYEMISYIDRPLVAVFANRDSQVQNCTMYEDTAADFLRSPLQRKRSQNRIGDPTHSCVRSARKFYLHVNHGDEHLYAKPCSKEVFVADIR